MDNTDHTSDYGQIVRRLGVADSGRVWRTAAATATPPPTSPKTSKGRQMSSEDSGGWDFSSAAATPAGGLGTIPPVPPPTNVGTPGSGPGDPGRPGVGNRVGNLVRTFVRGVGQTLITLGLVLLLFVVYEVWVSNIFAHQR
ncbi:MAG: hypothetical protein QOE89_1195, partial [Pseudonocardiales bacterium]|nr:hypothetical protein [Pseudonocardiales bacterium]